MNDDYTLCGWRVRSALVMPELLSWQGDDRPVDVEILLDSIPVRCDTPIFVLPHSRVWADGVFLLAMDGLGRFWVEGGRRVIVEPAPDMNEAELRGFILGSVLGALCHQRALLPIHASAVRVGNSAILIAGISGAGKSTLAAALSVCGYPLIADDVTAFDPVSRKVLPAFPQRKLALDVMEELRLDHVGMIPNRLGQPKFRVPALADFTMAPLAPSAIFLLTSAIPGKSPGFKHAPKASAMKLIDNMIYRGGIGKHIQSPQVLFQALGKLVQMTHVYVMPSGRGQPLSALGQLAERVAEQAQNI